MIGLWESEMMATRKPEHELYRKLLNYMGSTETQRWLNSNEKFSSPVTDVTFKVIGLGCAVLWATGFISGWPGKQGGTKPIWDRRAFWSRWGSCCSQCFHLWFMALSATKPNLGDSNTSSNKRRPGSEPPAMVNAPVLLEGWRVYERTMVQRNRTTLPAGLTPPPHEVLIPSACYQICKGGNHPSSHKYGLCINTYSSFQIFLIGQKQGQ
ncbi:hypothetical protein CSKR_111019 [Clonorchis sinensis]|uniref:Uncharacterized protein n=1 Tax=Clonorchis sinensis TaxID=79923 RepID=A0A419PK61_CLOSI|nr:hypothetical protein CSKR_111019 [Clonorchis sinensis]